MDDCLVRAPIPSHDVQLDTMHRFALDFTDISGPVWPMCLQYSEANAQAYHSTCLSWLLHRLAKSVHWKIQA